MGQACTDWSAQELEGPLALGCRGDLIGWATAWLRGWGRKGHKKCGPWDFNKVPPHHNPHPCPTLQTPSTSQPFITCDHCPRAGPSVGLDPGPGSGRARPAGALTLPPASHGGFINCLY